MTARAAALDSRWMSEPRWAGVSRNYRSSDVVRLAGSVVVEQTIARLGAERLWASLQQATPVAALGTLSGGQAIQAGKAGLQAIYCSGWQVAADANSSGNIYPDQSLYPVNSVPQLVKRINNAFARLDQIESQDGNGGAHHYLPIVADAEAGFGGALNVFELIKALIEAGAAGVHLEDQLASEKKCGHLGGKVLIPTQTAIRHLLAARHFGDALDTPNRPESLAQMRQVLHLNLDHAEDTGVLALELETPNVGLRLAHRRRNICIETPSIARFNSESNLEALALNFLPVNLESPLRLVVKQHQVGTIRAMDAHTTTACHISGDRITGHGLATLRVSDQQSVGALNPYAASSSANTINESLEPIWAWWFLPSIDLRMQLTNHVAPTQLTLPHGTYKMRTVGKLEAFRRGLQVVIGRTRNATALRLLVDHLATKFDGGLLLLHTKPLLDTMTRSTGAHVRQPIAVGARGWRCDDLDCIGVLQFA